MKVDSSRILAGKGAGSTVFAKKTEQFGFLKLRFRKLPLGKRAS